MQDQTKYSAFISYSHADARQARSIHRFIETYSIPKYLIGRRTHHGVITRRLRPVFKDREELPTASDLSAVVNDALRTSEHLIIVCSPKSASSKWVNEEVLTFKRMGRADRILCVIVAGQPNASDIPGREAEECFCDALRFQMGENGLLTRERAGPVAADARPGGDGLRLARLKLVAGMLGVGLDELRQRDLQRRHRRMAAITAASLVGMAVTLFLAWTASVARNDAENRREQADDLIGFMLGDLRERLNEVGRLDVLDSVTVKALEYFAKLPAKDLNDEALATRAEALLQLGQVQLTRGRLDDAMGPFQESLRAIEELSARDPVNLDLLYDLGQAHFWVGYVHWENKDYDAADKRMQQYYGISETLYNAAPNNDDYILELGYSHNNLAILSDRRGDVKAALDYNQRMIDLSRTIFNRDRNNEAYRRALAEAYSWGGSMLRNDNQLAAAAARFAEYLHLAEEASNADPDDTQWIDHRMLAHRFLAEGALETGIDDTARVHYRAGMVLAEQLTKIEPANMNWQIEGALFELRLAQMSFRDGEINDGLLAIDTARAKVREHLVANPDSTDWLLVSTKLELVTGKALLEQGDLGGAASVASNVVDAARQLLAANPTSVPTRVLLTDSLILSARIATRDSKLQREDPAWREALAVFDQSDRNRFNPDERDAFICASLYAGRTDYIDDEIEVLRQAGYRHPDFVAALHAHGIDY
jgi:tetratricopeptide (TPR) repeat protein